MSDGVDHAAAAEFERHRPRLLGLGYRMLGSLAEAEDVVQEAYLRWHRTPQAEVRDPLAWLIAAVTRLAIDELRRQRVRRQSYVGPWLPEPWVMPDELTPGEAEQQLDLADDLSVAFLLLLERLAPEERAALLLHDVFEAGYPDIAATLGKSPAAVRQLVSRARRRVSAERQRYPVSADARRDLVRRFQQALAARDDAELLKLFAEDAELLSDGGGKAAAALRPIRGAAKIVRFFLGVSRGYDLATVALHDCLINGAPGFVARDGDGTLLGTFAFESSGGQVRQVYVVRNPDKLGRLGVSGQPMASAGSTTA
ncbi:MAG: RNA polymerase sigma factor SigJ [Pseudomonadales bacterium]